MAKESTAFNGKTAVLGPITHRDAERVGAFLNQHLNQRISPKGWAEALQPSWQVNAPNHGFMLVAGNEVVGAQLAFYSERRTAHGLEPICNLAAFCVREDYRNQSLRLLKAVLSQRAYSFTDLSPSGNVRPLNLRLGFRKLDTATALVFNLPRPSWRGGTRLITDPKTIAATLIGADLAIYQDHQGAQAAHHLVVSRGDEHCYVIFRKDRRKGIPLFATLLHVGNPDLFKQIGHRVFSHLLTWHGIPLTLAELRVVKHRPAPSVMLRSNRVKMFLSNRLGPETIDYLYSELTCVAW